MSASRNPFAYREPITLETLGNLFSHHRSLTGGWSMETGDEGGDGSEDKNKNYTAPATQADLDRIVGERLARERDKAREKYADYDDLKKKAAEFDTLAEASRTEQERAVEAARKEGEGVATERANARLVKAEARALAAQAGLRSLSDVNLLDLSAVKVGEDGNVDAEAVNAELKKLTDAEPWRIDDGKKPAPKPDHSQGGGGSDAKPSVSRGRDLYAEKHAKKAAGS